MISRFLYYLFLAFSRYPKLLKYGVLLLVGGLFVTLAIGKLYQSWDDDPDRGAVAIKDGAFGESYSTPVYLNQGWSASDSLWFYNTTQGSGMLPYDFFIALEQAESQELFRSAGNIDRYRYLPQKATFFNPDGLPVGIIKDTYQGKDYVGYTCAACHTGQVNYKGKAIRIDGGPAMSDMVGFLKGLQAAMTAAQGGTDKSKNSRFVQKVLALGNDYSSAKEVNADLVKWTDRIALYNAVNNSTHEGKKIEYGHARLDVYAAVTN